MPVPVSSRLDTRAASPFNESNTPVKLKERLILRPELIP